MLICKECGSPNVIEPRWVDPNTGLIEYNNTGLELLDSYCKDCNDTVKLKSVEDGKNT